jgi:hypothetical protein
MMLAHVNYWAVLVAAVANQIIGAVWYGGLFMNPWMAAVGVTKDSVDKSRANKGYLIAFICSLIRAYMLAILAYGLGVNGWVPAIQFGLGIGLGIVFATMIPAYYFPNRPRSLLLIDGGHSLTAIVVASIIVSLWR